MLNFLVTFIVTFTVMTLILSVVSYDPSVREQQKQAFMEDCLHEEPQYKCDYMWSQM